MIDPDSGGKFVTAVEGVKQDMGKKLAWLYYINGKAAQKGAAEIKLAPGDVEEDSARATLTRAT